MLPEVWFERSLFSQPEGDHVSIKYATVTVTATTYTAITVPSVDAGFAGAVSVSRVSGTPDVFVSFDGSEDNGRLIASVTSAINFEQAYQKVWLRLGSAGTADVQVIVESRG